MSLLIVVSLQKPMFRQHSACPASTAPVAVPVKTVQETVAAGDMPPLDVEAGNVILAPFPNNLNPVESFNVKTDFDLQGDGPGRPGVVCAPSTLFQLYLVPHRRQGVQRLSQGGIPGVFQHV